MPSTSVAPLAAPFVRRWQSEGMVESICATCFVIVCREPTLRLAEDCEDAHHCPGPPHLHTEEDWPASVFGFAQ